jgi:hypothetical protein
MTFNASGVGVDDDDVNLSKDIFVFLTSALISTCYCHEIVFQMDLLSKTSISDRERKVLVINYGNWCGL